MKNYDLFSTFMPWRESGKSEKKKVAWRESGVDPFFLDNVLQGLFYSKLYQSE